MIAPIVKFYNEKLIGKPCQELPVEISIAFLGFKVFPEQCIILCPECAIKGFESLLKRVASECCHLSLAREAKK